MKEHFVLVTSKGKGQEYGKYSTESMEELEALLQHTFTVELLEKAPTWYCFQQISGKGRKIGKWLRREGKKND